MEGIIIGIRPHNQTPVEPIRDPADIERVRKHLKRRPRDRLLFELAIHTGIPVKWMLNLRVADLAELAPGENLVVKNDRGHRVGVLELDENLQQIWGDYLTQWVPDKGEYIFRSRKGSTPLKLSTVTNMVNEWFDALGLVGPRGIKSLHRTYEYHFAGSSSPLRGVEGDQTSLEGLEPVELVSASEVVYQRLLEAIVSGMIPPGERLIPEYIANQMNVSRMPVREALQRLRAAGFVSVQGRGSMIVNKLSREDLDEIQHIRLLLEQDAAGMAAERCDHRTIKKLEAIHRVFSKALVSGQNEISVRRNKEFHMTIYQQAGMPILLKMIESLLDRVGPYIHIELQEFNSNDEHMRNTISNHQRMLDALRVRDPAKLKYWLALDHAHTTSRILSYIDNHDSNNH